VKARLGRRIELRTDVVLRATGLTPSFIHAPFDQRLDIDLVEGPWKPSSVNGAGERSSQAAKDVNGRPAS